MTDIARAETTRMIAVGALLLATVLAATSAALLAGIVTPDHYVMAHCILLFNGGAAVASALAGYSYAIVRVHGAQQQHIDHKHL